MLHQEWYRTKTGIISTIYSAQKRKSKDRGMELPSYTKQELSDWLYSKDTFHQLFNEYVNSGYSSKLRPSIDRIDDNKPYIFSNIQLVTWGINQDRAYKSLREAKNDRHISYPVAQYSITGEHIADYISFKDAHRETGVDDYSIALCARGLKNKKHAGGYIWKLIPETKGEQHETDHQPIPR